MHEEMVLIATVIQVSLGLAVLLVTGCDDSLDVAPESPRAFEAGSAPSAPTAEDFSLPDASPIDRDPPDAGLADVEPTETQPDDAGVADASTDSATVDATHPPEQGQLVGEVRALLSPTRAHIRVSVGSAGLESVTGDDGRYAFTLPEGHYTVAFLAAGHSPHALEGVSVVAGGVTTVDPVVLDTERGAFRGRVVLPDGNAPVQNDIDLRLILDGGVPTQGIQYWEDGSFFLLLRPTVGRLEIRVENHRMVERIVEVEARQMVELGEILLEPSNPAPPAFFFGEAQYVDRFDYAGIRVDARERGGRVTSTVTSPLGAWSLAVEPGEYDILFSAPGYVTSGRGGGIVGSGVRIEIPMVRLEPVDGR